MVKISIIIPVYNVEQYIEKALDSLRNQTLKELEFICVDDCSSDNSRTILEKYASMDNRFKLIFLKENEGQGRARNIALKEVKGEYIMFLDPDDWFADNACELAYNKITSCKSDVTIFNYNIYYEKNGKIKPCNRIKRYKNSMKNNFKLSELSLPSLSGGSVWEYIYQTSFIKKNNILFGDKLCGEDNIFYVKVMSLAEKISVMDDYLYYYRKRKNNSSSACHPELFFDVLDSKEECFDFFKHIQNSQIYLAGIDFCINSTIFNYKRYNKFLKNTKIKKLFYNKVKLLFQKLNKEIRWNKETDRIANKSDFKKILKNSYYSYYFLKFIENIFSIKVGNERLMISVLWIRISLKF